MDALQLAGHPPRLFFVGSEFDNANLLAFRASRGQEFLGEVGADRVLPDHLGGHAQNVGRRAVIFRQADAESVRIVASLRPGKFFEEKLKARTTPRETGKSPGRCPQPQKYFAICPPAAPVAAVARCWCPEIHPPGCTGSAAGALAAASCPYPAKPPRWGSTIPEKPASFRAAVPRWRDRPAQFPARAPLALLARPACQRPETPAPVAIRVRASPRTAGNLRPKPVHPGSARKIPQSRSEIRRAPPAGGICRDATAPGT